MIIEAASKMVIELRGNLDTQRAARVTSKIENMD